MDCRLLLRFILNWFCFQAAEACQLKVRGIGAKSENVVHGKSEESLLMVAFLVITINIIMTGLNSWS